MEESTWRIYPQIEPGKVYDTVINGREVGKTLMALLGGRHKTSVFFVEDEYITCYGFNCYDVREGRLVLENAFRRSLSYIESGLVARQLKRSGLLKNA